MNNISHHHCHRRCCHSTTLHLSLNCDRGNKQFVTYEFLIHLSTFYNLVIEFVTRTDFERNKLSDVVSSLSAVAGTCDEALAFADKLLIIIGWHISVIGRIVFELSDDVVNERHLAMSKFKSFRCPARPAAAKGNGTNRWSTWNLCSSRYFFEQKHR